MNKGRRQELKKLKWKKRLKQLGLTSTEENPNHTYKQSGTPCSCGLCRGVKFREERNKKKNKF